jgi:L-2-hydroxyglutarate oxidase LhgO
VAAEHLVPDYAGVRPKLTAAGEATRDYIVRHEVERGLAGLVNLIGIDAPGLTAALGLAEAVDELLADLL